MADNPSISVVIPVYNEEESLEILYSELSQVLEPIANWEIIIVDDGSDDDSFPVLKKMVNEGLMQSDGIHPNVLGHKQIENIIWERLNKYLEK